MYQINSGELLQDIQNVFTNLQYPGDNNLVYDNSDNYLDVVETKEAYRGKHWKELSIDIINRHRDDLPAFTVAAFCFYLPALLTASIVYPLSLIDVLPDNLIADLTPRDEIEGGSDRLNAILCILTLPQKKVVRDFLEWYLNKYILDVPGLPEELKDLLSMELKKVITFWQNTILTGSRTRASE